MTTNNIGKKEEEKEFANRLAGTVINGFTAMGIAMGCKLGLFQSLSKFDSPATAKEIADAAGYKERYVKEWLRQMAVSDIVHISPDGEAFFLPEHRRETMESSSAICTQFLPVWGSVVGDLAHCFKKDGPRGIPFDKVKGTIGILMEGHNVRYKINPDFAKEFVDSVPGLIAKLDKGIKVADLGCGRADEITRLASIFPKSHFIGLDYCQEFVDICIGIAKDRGLSNIEFLCGDMYSLPPEWSKSFDYILTYDVIHDLAYIDKALGEIERILKDDGIYSVVEIKAHSNPADNVSNPGAPVLYGISQFFCMVTSLNFDNGMGFGTCMGVEKLRELLKEANLKVLMEGNPPPPSDQIHVVCGKVGGKYPEFISSVMADPENKIKQKDCI